jgi:hypothetical protein
MFQSAGWIFIDLHQHGEFDLGTRRRFYGLPLTPMVEHAPDKRTIRGVDSLGKNRDSSPKTFDPEFVGACTQGTCAKPGEKNMNMISYMRYKLTSGPFGDSMSAAARPKRWGVFRQAKGRELKPWNFSLYLLDGAWY